MSDKINVNSLAPAEQDAACDAQLVEQRVVMQSREPDDRKNQTELPVPGECAELIGAIAGDGFFDASDEFRWQKVTAGRDARGLQGGLDRALVSGLLSRLALFQSTKRYNVSDVHAYVQWLSHQGSEWSVGGGAYTSMQMREVFERVLNGEPSLANEPEEDPDRSIHVIMERQKGEMRPVAFETIHADGTSVSFPLGRFAAVLSARYSLTTPETVLGVTSAERKLKPF